MSTIGLDRNASADRARFSPISWGHLRIVIAALLAIAAAAKIQDITTILAGDGLLSSKPLLLTAIGVEAALATYLLLGNRHWSWRLTVALFSVFVVASGYAWFSGQDCNCISQRIGPGWLFMLDLGLLVLLARCRPQNFKNAEMVFDERKRRWLPITVSAIAALLLVATAIWRLDSIRRSPPVDYLFADTWKGKSWPLTGHLDQRFAPFENGRWLVVIVRRDCEHCEELLDEYFRDPTNRRPGERTAVIVADSAQWTFELDRVSLSAPNKNVINWAGNEPNVSTPAVFQLVEGQVVEAADGTEAGELCERLLRIASRRTGGDRSDNTGAFL